MFEGSGNRQQKERPGWGKRLKFLTQKIDMGNFAMLFELERQVEAGFSISRSGIRCWRHYYISLHLSYSNEENGTML